MLYLRDRRKLVAEVSGAQRGSSPNERREGTNWSVFEAAITIAEIPFRRRGSDKVEAIEPLRAAALNDQHAYLDLGAAFRLGVGDLVAFGISHPCTTFDKWAAMALVDDNYNVIEMLETFF